MPILTLTTDFGTKSFDVAALKGKLMCASPNTKIIDITHSIEIYDKINAAYELKNASLNFPNNTIHFTNINLKEGNNRFLIVSRNNQYYVCPDNGIITMMFPLEDFKAYAINGLEKDFTYKEVNTKLCEILVAFENNENILDLGTFTNSYLKAALVRASQMTDLIRASVIYIDRYDNAIINVNEEMFYNFIQNSPFTISYGTSRVHKISKHYSEVEPGEMLCLFNDAGLLEIAINTHKSTQLLGLSTNSIVLIEKR